MEAIRPHAFTMQSLEGQPSRLRLALAIQQRLVKPPLRLNIEQSPIRMGGGADYRRATGTGWPTSRAGHFGPRILPSVSAFVFAPEEIVRLRLMHNEPREALAPACNHRRCDHETIAAQRWENIAHATPHQKQTPAVTVNVAVQSMRRKRDRCARSSASRLLVAPICSQ
jgi:hypothetical protein